MPELPDVEVFRRYISSTALHKRVKSVDIDIPARMRDQSVKTLGAALKNARLDATDRHGKFLFVYLRKAHQTHRWLVLHFGMTGYLKYLKRGDSPPHTLLELSLENGYRMAYAAPRKLGHVGLTKDPSEFAKRRKLGVDALDVDRDTFRQLGHGRGALKPWLMKQHAIAGIGNVYADEILFQARIDPRTARTALNHKQWNDLHSHMRSVLKAAIAAQADPQRMPRSFLLPHRHEGGKCPRCRQSVRNVTVSGRTTWFCPHCQKRIRAPSRRQ